MGKCGSYEGLDLSVAAGDALDEGDHNPGFKEGMEVKDASVPGFALSQSSIS